jgi:hypothetical protein
VVAITCAALLLFAMLATALLGVLAGAPSAGASGAEGLSCSTSPAGRGEIPPALLPLYETASAANGLGGRGVFVLAAINRIETHFGRNQGPSSAGAVGWMQFMPATWARWGLDGDVDGRRDPADPADAIPTAARYLRASGAPEDWYRAVFAYNHADWYVVQVLALASRYEGACVTTVAESPDGGAVLIWPTAAHTVTAPFGEPRPGHLHAGIDIGAPLGAPVWAAAAGTVVLVQTTATSGGYGNYVCIQHGTAIRTCYAHLSAIYVRTGDAAAAGQVLGACGSTGHSFGPHLHFEVRVGPDWRATDPTPYL